MVWVPGMLLSQGYPYTARTLPKGTAAAITRGQVVCADPSTHLWRVAVATDLRPFGIALKDAATADNEVLDVLTNPGTEGTVTADAAINPFEFVKATAAGRVIKWVQGTDSDELRVGLYLGTEGHMDGKTPAVAAAQNDVIAIRRVE